MRAGKDKLFRNDKGMVLVTGLLVITALMLLGLTAVISSTTDLKITAYYKISEESFYLAEAGIEEARARLRRSSEYVIDDNDPANAAWRRYIGSAANAEVLGFDQRDTTGNQVRLDSLSSLNYAVKIEHLTDASGQILYWGDADGNGIPERNPARGEVIYKVTSLGRSGSSQRTIVAEICHTPQVTVPGALYVEAATTIHGNSTHILGVDNDPSSAYFGSDPCGGAGAHGIVSARPYADVIYNGNPTVTGISNPDGKPPDAVYNQTDMDVDSMVNLLKESANYAYDFTSGTTDTGMNWGTPSPGPNDDDPSSCSVSHVVYYQMNGTEVKLDGGSQGCGLLLVDGDLAIQGGFSWYGVILVTGSVTFSGGGTKNVTGGVISGGSIHEDVVGGGANIVYCSAAIRDQTYNSPLKRLSWKEEDF